MKLPKEKTNNTTTKNDSQNVENVKVVQNSGINLSGGWRSDKTKSR